MHCLPLASVELLKSSSGPHWHMLSGALSCCRCVDVGCQVDMSLGASTPLRAVRQLVPWHRQYKVLLARAFKEQIR